MGLFEKRRFKNFLSWVNDYDQNNPATFKKVDPMKVPMIKVFEYFELEPNTIDFVGHATALYTNDTYLN